MASESFPPARPIHDYLLGSARYGLPDYKNTEKWNNRIINNLLYYQSNYAITASIIFCIVGYIRPYEMIAGGFILMIFIAATAYTSSNRDEVRKFKKDYPHVVVIGIVGTCTLVMYVLGSIIVFIFGIALPLLCILMHASLRMRNLKNKVMNSAEFVGLKSTPMGKFLKALDQDL